MTGERMYPVLPCPDLDEALDFWAAVGFRQTFVQRRPYPCAVVERDDMAVHLSGIDGFDPATSVSSVVVVVPDAGALHASFAAGLRARYGRLPVSGAPRLLRPRRKQGTTTGFSLVDTGGCWVRFYGSTEDGGTDGGSDEDAAAGDGDVLRRAVEVAARQGDARGEEDVALGVLDRALARHPDVAGPSRVRALLYRGELLVRLGRPADAATALDQAGAVDLTPQEALEVQEERDHVAALVHEAGA